MRWTTCASWSPTPGSTANSVNSSCRATSWLDELARQEHGRPFITLDFDDKDRLLRQITRSAAGENWVSTLLTYLFEALLTAPAYGGNTDGLGWRWLQYVPGFPLPGRGTRYTELPL